MNIERRHSAAANTSPSALPQFVATQDTPQSILSTVEQKPLDAAKEVYEEVEISVDTPISQRVVTEYIRFIWSDFENIHSRKELLEKLASYKAIHKLDLGKCSLLTGSDITQILKAHPELEVLGLFHATIPDRELILEHKNLRNLNAYIESFSLERLKLVLPKLEKVYPCWPKSIKHLEIEAPSLKKLKFFNGSFESLTLKLDAMEQFGIDSFNHLTYLSIEGKSLQKLRVFFMEKLESFILKAPELLELDIFESGLAMKTLKFELLKLKDFKISHMKQLEDLVLKAPHLKKLYLGSSPLSQKPLQELINQAPEIEDFELREVGGSIEALNLQLLNLERLSLHSMLELKQLNVTSPKLARFEVENCDKLERPTIQRILDQSQFLKDMEFDLIIGNLLLKAPKLNSSTTLKKEPIIEVREEMQAIELQKLVAQKAEPERPTKEIIPQSSSSAPNPEDLELALKLGAKLGSNLAKKLLEKWTKEKSSSALIAIREFHLANLQK